MESARGEAVRFEKLLAEYELAPEVTRARLYLDAVQEVMSSTSKVLVDVEGGNNMMYLPLDKLTQGGTTRASQGKDASPIVTEEVYQGIVERLRQDAASSRRSQTVR